MFYFHKNKMTRSKKWRSAIIVVEILVLVLAVFFNNSQDNRSVDSIVLVASDEVKNEANPIKQTVYVSSDTEGRLHGMAFYVDYWYRVRVLDNGVMQEFARFDDCSVQLLKSQEEAQGIPSPERGITYLTLATIRQGISFYAESYEVVVAENTVTLITSNNGSYQFAQDCAADGYTTRDSRSNSGKFLPEMQSGSR